MFTSDGNKKITKLYSVSRDVPDCVVNFSYLQLLRTRTFDSFISSSLLATYDEITQIQLKES